MSASVNTFANNILRSRLIGREELTAVVKTFGRQANATPTATDLAAFLVQRQLLTSYQARRILAGRTEGFFLGHCRILERIGEGGMGVVYRARQERLDRDVAIKVLPFHGSRDAQAVQRLHREARAAARLKHPNIVQVFDIDSDGDTHFIIMELVSGQNLRELVRKHGPLPPPRSASLIHQAALGLAHAHEHGVIHRDIKPANLIVERSSLRILDLGLARIESDEPITKGGDLLGTLDYMSPEQCSDSTDIDHRTDIYSLGCTWFHLLTGNPPFSDRPAAGKIHGHVSDGVPAVDEALPGIPDEIVRIVEKMTEINRKLRYHNAVALVADLEQCLDTWDQLTVAANTNRDTVSRLRDSTTEQQSVDHDEHDEDSEYETLVHAPRFTIPASLTYLIPVMAALVLGGIYIGIQLLKDRLPVSDTVIIDVPQSGAETEAGNGASPEPGTPPPRRSPEPDGTKDSEAVADPDIVTEGESGTPADSHPPQSPPPSPSAEDTSNDSTPPNPAPTEPPRELTKTPTAIVEPEPALARDPREFVVREFAPEWQQTLVDGDVLTLVSEDVYEMPEAVDQQTKLTIQGTESQRALLSVTASRDTVFWQLSNTSLTLRNVDLYVDAADVGPGPFTLFGISAGNIRITDSTITIQSAVSAGPSQITMLRLTNANFWDPSGKGDAPPPLSVIIERTLVRGPGTLLENSSPNSQVSIVDSLIVGTGPAVHAFHKVPREFDHQTMNVQVDRSTFDIEQPLITIDCRPFDLRPVPARIQFRHSVVCTMGSVGAQAPLIYWASPTDTSAVADGITVAGSNNVYIRRKNALMIKSVDGEVRTIAREPADWNRQGLGQDVSSTFEESRTRSFRSEWHERTGRDYDPKKLPRGRLVRSSAGPPPGVSPRDVGQPRRLPSRRR